VRAETITVVAPLPADLRELWGEITAAPLPSPGASG
jgi:hypothetical protein